MKLLSTTFITFMFCLMPFTLKASDITIKNRSVLDKVAETSKQVQAGRYILNRLGYLNDPLAALNLQTWDSMPLEQILSTFSVNKAAASKSLSFLLQRFEFMVGNLTKAIAEQEIDSIIILGAGDSPLAMYAYNIAYQINVQRASKAKRMYRHFSPKVIEIDTDYFKLLRKHRDMKNISPVVSLDNLFALNSTLPADIDKLADDIESILLNSSKPRLIIAEGLLHYLTPEDNLAIESLIQKITPPGSIYLADTMNDPALKIAKTLTKGYELGQQHKISVLENALRKTGYTPEMVANFKSSWKRFGSRFDAADKEEYVVRYKTSSDLKKSLDYSHLDQVNFFDRHIRPSGIFNKIIF